MYFLLVFPNYRPQRSWAKVMFLQASVILSTRGVSASVHAGIPHPLEQTPPRADTPHRPDTPPGADTPQSRQPPPPPRSRHTLPPRADTPQTRHPPEADTPPEQTPPREADSSIRSTSGRHASYWNAFLFCTTFLSYLYMIQNKVIELFSFR